MRGALLLGILLLASGCLGATNAPTSPPATYAPSAPTHTIGRTIDLSIPMSDGAKLHGTAFLPDGVDKAPSLVDMSPYFGDLYLADTEQPPSSYMTHLLARGYAVVHVSVRGTGSSEGCFMVGGAQERDDAARMVAWIANRSWSDGTVGMMGISYDGTTPWEAAVTGVPQLKAIVPGEGITDMYAYSFFDGVPINNGASFQALYVPQTDYAYDDPSQVPGWAAAQPTAQCRAGQPSVMTEPYETEMDGTHGSAYWLDRDQASRIAGNMTAGAFVVQGFQDYNVRMDEVQDLWSVLPEPKAFVLGQWKHEVAWHTSQPKYDFVAFNATLDTFLDDSMRSDPAARAAWDASPHVFAEDDQARWWNLTAWPPPSNDLALTLGANGKLGAAATPGTLSWRTDPAPYGIVGYQQDLPNVEAAQDPAGLRVVLRGEPLASATLVMGDPWVNLTLKVDQAGGYVVAKLLDIKPDGSYSNVTFGYLDLKQRDGRDKSEDVPTGSDMQVRVRMYGQAHVFPAGHRIGLLLAGNDPDINPGPTTPTVFTATVGQDSVALHVPVYVPTQAPWVFSRP